MELWISIALVSLISTVALAQDDVFDPTSRDYTYKCESMAKKAREGEQCPLFEMCCNTFAGDRMNGDKCQLPDPKNGCEYNEQTGETIMLCKAYNCTEMVTTTTTTTTPRPIRIETKGSSSKTGQLLLELYLMLILNSLFCDYVSQWRSNTFCT